MKLLDEKGRVFGKINLFDLVIIGFAVLVVSFTFVNIAFRGKLSKKISDIPELKYVVIDVILPEDLTWIKEHINVGDILQTSYCPELTVSILKIKESSAFGQSKRLVIKIKVFAAKEGPRLLTFGKHPIRIGEEIPFFTDRHMFSGQIVDIDMTGKKISLKD